MLARILQGAAEEYRDIQQEIEAWIEPDIDIAGNPVRPGGGAADRMITGDNTEKHGTWRGTVNYDIRLQAYYPRSPGQDRYP